MADTENNSWVDGYIDNLANVIRTNKGIPVADSTGQTVLVAIEGSMLQFLIDNRFYLAQIGIDVFKEFLGYLSKGQNFDALVKVYQGLDNSALILKAQEDTVKLAEIAAQTQASRDFWVQFATQAVEKIVFSALGSLIP